MNKIVLLFGILAFVLLISQTKCGDMSENEKMAFCISQFEEYYLIDACMKDKLWER